MKEKINDINQELTHKVKAHVYDQIGNIDELYNRLIEWAGGDVTIDPQMMYFCVFNNGDLAIGGTRAVEQAIKQYGCEASALVDDGDTDLTQLPEGFYVWFGHAELLERKGGSFTPDFMDIHLLTVGIRRMHEGEVLAIHRVTTKDAGNEIAAGELIVLMGEQHMIAEVI